MKSTICIIIGFISFVLATYLGVVTFTYDNLLVSCIAGLFTIVFTLTGVFLFFAAFTMFLDSKSIHEFEDANEDIYRNCL